MKFIGSALAAMALLAAAPAQAQAPQPRQMDWVAKDFVFHTGEHMDLKLHVTTLGNPASPAVLVLHGTTSSGRALLAGGFGDQLFGPGQPLDAAKYYIILPDSIGAGLSSKPSDGLKMKFPHYNYDDMVAATWRLLTEGMGVKHLRLVTGNSMGGMLTWMWGEAHPDFMDALLPLASTPGAMSGRNWMLRRMLIESIERDPSWNGGNYTKEPAALATASVMFAIATSGGTQGWQAQAPTAAAADKLVDARLDGSFGDANDAIYQWASSRDYDPSPGLERITAPLLAINASDDERNPPELGVLQRAMGRVKNGRAYIIPASGQTRGHGTTGQAKFWAPQLTAFLAGVKAR